MIERKQLSKKKPAKKKVRRSRMAEVGKPWGRPVNGERLLNDLTSLFPKYAVLPKGGAEVLALWALHTHAHAYKTSRISPFICVTSPEEDCGKTTVMEMLVALCPNPQPTSDPTAASIHHEIKRSRNPTFFFDEVDSYENLSRGLRGVLNAGHARTFAVVTRAKEKFSIFAPKAFSLIGGLPKTLESRSIIISMDKKLPSEKIEELEVGESFEEFVEFIRLNRQAARFVKDNKQYIRLAQPDIPEILNNRAKDNWRVLLAIAEVVGGEWPKRVYRIAEKFGRTERDEQPAVELVKDLKQMFRDEGVDRLSSKKIVKNLNKMEHRLWPEFNKGRPITQNNVAHLLKTFKNAKIRPGQMTIDGKNSRGYKLKWFEDVFKRYAVDETPKRKKKKKSRSSGLAVKTRVSKKRRRR